MTYNMAIENCWEINLNYLWRRIFAVWLRLEELQILLFPYFYSLPSFRLWTENSCVLCSGITAEINVGGAKIKTCTFLCLLFLPFLWLFLSPWKVMAPGVVKCCLHTKTIPFQWDLFLLCPDVTQPSTKKVLEVLEIHFYRINLVQMRFFLFCF